MLGGEVVPGEEARAEDDDVGSHEGVRPGLRTGSSSELDGAQKPVYGIRRVTPISQPLTFEKGLPLDTERGSNLGPGKEEPLTSDEHKAQSPKPKAQSRRPARVIS